jgi:hypothetical protein
MYGRRQWLLSQAVVVGSRPPAAESFLCALSGRFLRTSRLQVFPARSKQKLLTAKIAKGAEDRKERRLSREFFGAPEGRRFSELLRLYFWLWLVNARDHLLHALEFSSLVTVVLLRQAVGFCFDGFFAIVGIGVIRQEL